MNKKWLTISSIFYLAVAAAIAGGIYYHTERVGLSVLVGVAIVYKTIDWLGRPLRPYKSGGAR